MTTALTASKWRFGVILTHEIMAVSQDIDIQDKCSVDIIVDQSDKLVISGRTDKIRDIRCSHGRHTWDPSARCHYESVMGNYRCWD